MRPVDGSGRVADFHALRGAFISRLVETGASLKVCMELARHSDPKLTLKTYAKVRMHDVGTALEKMATAGRSHPPTVEARATGTDERSISTGAARSAARGKAGQCPSRRVSGGDDRRTPT